MSRSLRSTAVAPLVSAFVWSSAGCGAPPPERVTKRVAPAPAAYAAGPRVPHLDPVARLDGACPAEVVCSFTDVNGDDKPDLVRRDPLGALGSPGSMAVALGNGWGFGPFEETGASCADGEVCIVADLDGIRGAEVLRIVRELGQVVVEGFGTDPNAEPTEPVELAPEGVCADEADRCTLVSFDEDAAAELAWIDPEGTLRVFDLGDPGDFVEHETSCGDGRQCRFVELDGLPGAELISWALGEPGLHVVPLGQGEEWTLPVDCGENGCGFADLDGDGLTDFLAPGPELEAPLRWMSGEGWEYAQPAPQGATCGSEDRCLWLDVNADRFADLVRFEPDGTVAVHPSFDARGRLEAATLALSVLEATQARARIATVDAYRTAMLIDATPAPVDPPLIPEASFDAQRTALVNRIDAAIGELIAAIPAEGTVTTERQIRQVEELSLSVAIGRTIVAAAPVGASSRAEGCANVVLHEQANHDGVDLRAPSYLFRYATALGTVNHSAQVGEMVDALTTLVGGFRCLSHFEIARLDAAFSDAVIETADELMSLGHEMAAKWLVDNALPIALLTFDATKYASLPASYQLLRARFEGGVYPGELPGEGFDFAEAADDPSCDSFVCQAYGHARRASPDGRGLRFDQLGVWLPDPLRSDRLRRIDVDPYTMLTELQDLRVLGEGDCALFEVFTGGFTCASRRTCDPMLGVPSAADELAEGPAVLEPGWPSAPRSHLQTDRSNLGTLNGCDGASGSSGAPAGGVAVAGCLGPQLDSRRGRFSADPELDNLMSCALESGATPVDLAVNVSEECLLGQEGGEEGDDDDDDDAGAGAGDGGDAGGGGGAEPADGPGGTTQSQRDAFQIVRDKIVTALRTDSPMRRAMVAKIREHYPHRTEAQVIAILSGHTADTVARARPMRLAVGTAGHTVPLGGEGADGGHSNIYIDVAGSFALHGADGAPTDMAQWLQHEAVHAFSLRAAWVHGAAPSVDREHAITGELGLGNQCAEGHCDNSCSVGDAWFDRFSECIDPAPGTTNLQDVQCSFAQDVCDDRRHGDMGFPVGGCGPALPSSLTNRECLVVQCGVDTSPIAHACCSSGAPESAPPIFVTAIGPGPMPPPPHADRFAERWATLELPGF